MSRSINLSPLGLYQWDNTIFNLMEIPEELDRNTLIDNILMETAELEVLYPNPTVFKNLVGIWSNKQVGIWEKLYTTTQYDYNPIENYNRYETGSNDGEGVSTHSGTDSTTEASTLGNVKNASDMTIHGGSDTTIIQNNEGGTEGEAISKQVAAGGSDTTTGTDTKGHWIAGFNSAASGSDDGLVKQTRDQDDASSTVTYGKTEYDTENKTTTFGKTVAGTDATTYGKTETRTIQDTLQETINKTGSLTHGEQVITSQEGSHELHAHGNIGVTTTQQLIKEQREIDEFNLYDIITKDFKMKFCVLIY